MNELLLFVACALLAWIGYWLMRLSAQSTILIGRVEQASNHSAALFYAVEQIYEMSGMDAAVDRDDEPPLPKLNDKAWGLLRQRMRQRMESVIEDAAVAAGAIEPEHPSIWTRQDIAEDADLALMLENNKDWTQRAIPRLFHWPPYPARVVSGVRGSRWVNGGGARSTPAAGS